MRSFFLDSGRAGNPVERPLWAKTGHSSLDVARSSRLVYRPHLKESATQAFEGATWLAAPDEGNMSTGHMEQTDLLSLCFVESVNRLRCRLNYDLALLLGKVGLGLGGEPHIALLARAKDKPPAPLFEHEFRFVLRHDVRGTVQLLREVSSSASRPRLRAE